MNWEMVDGSALRRVADDEVVETEFLHVSWSRKIKQNADLELIFAPYHPVNISRHKWGLAYVTFATSSDALKAKQDLHASEWKCIGGRRIFISFAITTADFRQPSPVHTDPLSISSVVPGLMLLLGFVSSEEESEIMRSLNQPPCVWRTNIKTRRVQHFGYEFDYNTRCCHANQPLTWRHSGSSTSTGTIQESTQHVWPTFLLPTVRRVSNYISNKEGRGPHTEEGRPILSAQ